jgi:hypothetical protein
MQPFFDKGDMKKPGTDLTNNKNLESRIKINKLVLSKQIAPEKHNQHQ